MGFKLPKGARDLYNAIDKRADGGAKFKMLFDPYFLCLMAGLDKGKIGSEEKLDSEEFLKDAYPETYADYGLLITALLIDAELRRQGIEPEDKKSTENLMISLIDPNSNTKLNSSGIDLLNRYSVTGMDIIREKIGKPSELEVLLSHYFKILNPEATTAV